MCKQTLIEFEIEFTQLVQRQFEESSKLLECSPEYLRGIVGTHCINLSETLINLSKRKRVNLSLAK